MKHFINIFHFHSTGFIQMVDILLKNGANVNAIDTSKNTPLHLAANVDEFLKLYEMIELLVNAGSDADLKNDRGEKPADTIYKVNGNKFTPLQNTLVNAKLNKVF